MSIATCLPSIYMNFLSDMKTVSPGPQFSGTMGDLEILFLLTTVSSHVRSLASTTFFVHISGM